MIKVARSYEVTLTNSVPGVLPTGATGMVVYHRLGSLFVSATIWQMVGSLWQEVRQDQFAQPLAIDEDRCLMQWGVSPGHRIRITA